MEDDIGETPSPRTATKSSNAPVLASGRSSVCPIHVDKRTVSGFRDRIDRAGVVEPGAYVPRPRRDARGGPFRCDVSPNVIHASARERGERPDSVRTAATAIGIRGSARPAGRRKPRDGVELARVGDGLSS